MHNHYKFEWIDPVKIDDKEYPAFRLTSRLGMVWEAHFSKDENTVRIQEDPLRTGGGLVKIDFEFTKGAKSTIPVKAYRYMNYKVGRSILKSIRHYAKMDVEDVKKELGV